MKKTKLKIGSNRSFGILFFIVFLIIGLWPLTKNESINIFPLIISIIFLVLGIFNSRFLTPLNKIWMRFGVFLGNFISPIVMGIVFFLVVTPTGFLVRLFGKDILNIKKKNLETYWIKKEKINSTMKNQF